ncbi:NUDIX hydrolase [Vibrio ostreicida]|uniref:NUDIX hydrolase n=1 Tax=Vibrio ostreicida TaxID=526588 RepID=UPI003B5AE27F
MKHLSMAVVIRQGKVLIQERDRGLQRRVVEFPGGYVEYDESGTDAALRVLFEETGLNDVSHVATYSDINEFGGRIYYVLLRQITADEPIASDVSRQQTFHWYQPDQIPSEKFHAADCRFIRDQLVTHVQRDLHQMA